MCHTPPLGTIELNGAHLIAEVNSAARAAAIHKIIETQLIADVCYRATEIQSLEKMLADSKAIGGVSSSAAREESERLAKLPEIRAKIDEMLAAHWER